jgi:antitoxin (DNA-binding transcriptional repressor) of toxin-antitoxin stability system
LFKGEEKCERAFSAIDKLTIYGHHVTMKANPEDSVRIAEFKSRLSHHLRKVRQGHPLVLLDRDTPIARVLPYPSGPGKLRSRKPTRESRDINLPPPLSKKINSLSTLLEERQPGR